jgi:hypothetical protein
MCLIEFFLGFTLSLFYIITKDKGIALMLGDPDTSRISTFEAQSLANQVIDFSFTKMYF